MQPDGRPASATDILLCWLADAKKGFFVARILPVERGHEILKVYTFVQVALIMLIHKVAGSILKVIFMCKVLTHDAPLDTRPRSLIQEKREAKF
jgi:hypothetical protein